MDAVIARMHTGLLQTGEDMHEEGGASDGSLEGSLMAGRGRGAGGGREERLGSLRTTARVAGLRLVGGKQRGRAGGRRVVKGGAKKQTEKERLAQLRADLQLEEVIKPTDEAYKQAMRDDMIRMVKALGPGALSHSTRAHLERLGVQKEIFEPEHQEHGGVTTHAAVSVVTVADVRLTNIDHPPLPIPMDAYMAAVAEAIDAMQVAEMTAKASASPKPSPRAARAAALLAASAASAGMHDTPGGRSAHSMTPPVSPPTETLPPAACAGRSQRVVVIDNPHLGYRESRGDEAESSPSPIGTGIGSPSPAGTPALPHLPLGEVVEPPPLSSPARSRGPPGSPRAQGKALSKSGDVVPAAPLTSFSAMFLNDDNVRLARTVFWFVFAAFFQKEDLPFFAHNLDRLAAEQFSSFWQSLRTRPAALHEYYHELYPIAVAHAICLASVKTFPGSRSLFRTTWADRVYVLVLKLLTGLEYNEATCSGLRQKYFAPPKAALHKLRAVHPGAATAALGKFQEVHLDLPRSEQSVKEVSVKSGGEHVQARTRKEAEAEKEKQGKQLRQREVVLSHENPSTAYEYGVYLPQGSTIDGRRAVDLQITMLQKNCLFNIAKERFRFGRFPVEVKLHISNPEFNVFNTRILDYDYALSLCRDGTTATPPESPKPPTPKESQAFYQTIRASKMITGQNTNVGPRRGCTMVEGHYRPSEPETLTSLKKIEDVPTDHAYVAKSTPRYDPFAFEMCAHGFRQAVAQADGFDCTNEMASYLKARDAEGRPMSPAANACLRPKRVNPLDTAVWVLALCAAIAARGARRGLFHAGAPFALEDKWEFAEAMLSSKSRRGGDTAFPRATEALYESTTGRSVHDPAVGGVLASPKARHNAPYVQLPLSGIPRPQHTEECPSRRHIVEDPDAADAIPPADSLADTVFAEAAGEEGCASAGGGYSFYEGDFDAEKTAHSTFLTSYDSLRSEGEKGTKTETVTGLRAEVKDMLCGVFSGLGGSVGLEGPKLDSDPALRSALMACAPPRQQATGEADAPVITVAGEGESDASIGSPGPKPRGQGEKLSVFRLPPASGISNPFGGGPATAAGSLSPGIASLMGNAFHTNQRKRQKSVQASPSKKIMRQKKALTGRRQSACFITEKPAPSRKLKDVCMQLSKGQKMVNLFGGKANPAPATPASQKPHKSPTSHPRSTPTATPLLSPNGAPQQNAPSATGAIPSPIDSGLGIETPGTHPWAPETPLLQATVKHTRQMPWSRADTAGDDEEPKRQRSAFGMRMPSPVAGLPHPSVHAGADDVKLNDNGTIRREGTGETRYVKGVRQLKKRGAAGRVVAAAQTRRRQEEPEAAVPNTAAQPVGARKGRDVVPASEAASDATHTLTAAHHSQYSQPSNHSVSYNQSMSHNQSSHNASSRRSVAPLHQHQAVELHTALGGDTGEWSMMQSMAFSGWGDAAASQHGGSGMRPLSRGTPGPAAGVGASMQTASGLLSAPKEGFDLFAMRPPSAQRVSFQGPPGSAGSGAAHRPPSVARSNTSCASRGTRRDSGGDAGGPKYIPAPLNTRHRERYKRGADGVVLGTTYLHELSSMVAGTLGMPREMRVAQNWVSRTLSSGMEGHDSIATAKRITEAHELAKARDKEYNEAEARKFTLRRTELEQDIQRLSVQQKHAQDDRLKRSEFCDQLTAQPIKRSCVELSEDTFKGSRIADAAQHVALSLDKDLRKLDAKLRGLNSKIKSQG